MVRGDQASGIDPQNASAAQCMLSEVPETIGISLYMYSQYLYVVFMVLEYSYHMIFPILFSLSCILGVSGQYITTTALTIVMNDIEAVGYPRTQVILLHPALQSTPIY